MSPRADHVGFMVDEVALGQEFLEHFVVLYQVSIPPLLPSRLQKLVQLVH
jgi:hypothetical protein